MATDPQHIPYHAEKRMSVEEYFQLDYTIPDTKYEYQDGQTRLMSGGTIEHDEIAFNTRTALKQQLRTGPCFVKGSDVRVQVSKSIYYFLDVTVSCDIADRQRGNTLIRSPRIVVEVLSSSTEKFDRIDKLKRYQSCDTIQEIVLISQFAPHVEVIRPREKENGTWSRTTYESGEEIVLESIDVHIPIEEIYQNINFEDALLENQ
jgi:Uma2 family endonuclease